MLAYVGSFPVKLLNDMETSNIQGTGECFWNCSTEEKIVVNLKITEERLHTKEGIVSHRIIKSKIEVVYLFQQQAPVALRC